MPQQDLVRISDDTRDFYGRDYWFQHQAGDLGQPTITERARTDLPERCVHWLRALLRHKLPPGQILEIGAAHGGFVALLRQAGFEATGHELSPAIVDLARSTFGVPMLKGPLEDHDILEGSLDVIALFDVMEHFQEPLATLRYCLRLLKPQGFLLIQTPRAPVSATYDDLVARQDPFLQQFKREEHLYLFTQDGVREVFRRLGASEIVFLPAIFAHYDMFFTASRNALPTYGDTELAAALQTPGQRFVLALLDLHAQHETLTQHLAAVEQDREARLRVINTLTERLRTLETKPSRACRKTIRQALIRWLSLFSGRRSS